MLATCNIDVTISFLLTNLYQVLDAAFLLPISILYKLLGELYQLFQNIWASTL